MNRRTFHFIHLQANNVQISTQTLQIVALTIESEIADIKAEMIKLISDKDTSYSNFYTDGSSMQWRFTRVVPNF